ncbi:MAG: hypothetical protein DSY43_06045 [Gammaproteobacteria bacterium]|nr:MAG: hypothetical protein DSY43_06045 [Gammaproteobacteria bacterium]
MEREDDVFQPSKRFRKARSIEEETKMLVNAVPISTRYKNRWAFKLFEDWRTQRFNKSPLLEVSILNTNLEAIENLDEDFVRMTPESLDFWIGKSIQEVAG